MTSLFQLSKQSNHGMAWHGMAWRGRDNERDEWNAVSGRRDDQKSHTMFVIMFVPRYTTLTQHNTTQQRREMYHLTTVFFGLCLFASILASL